ncbi:MAG: hypothetical protein SGPRY_003083 [Prymnesium sp.]
MRRTRLQEASRKEDTSTVPGVKGGGGGGQETLEEERKETVKLSRRERKAGVSGEQGHGCRIDGGWDGKGKNHSSKGGTGTEWFSGLEGEPNWIAPPDHVERVRLARARHQHGEITGLEGGEQMLGDGGGWVISAAPQDPRERSSRQTIWATRHTRGRDADLTFAETSLRQRGNQRAQGHPHARVPRQSSQVGTTGLCSDELGRAHGVVTIAVHFPDMAQGFNCVRHEGGAPPIAWTRGLAHAAKTQKTSLKHGFPMIICVSE